uniref:Secreted protein n=1 Tax=Callorhinchus milii TaxID=7868 RepID=A0A4W3K2Z1_CALMI
MYLNALIYECMSLLCLSLCALSHTHGDRRTHSDTYGEFLCVCLSCLCVCVSLSLSVSLSVSLCVSLYVCVQ